MNTTTQPAPSWMRLSCRIWGHVVDNHVFRSTRGDRRRCRCGVDYLPKTGETTHVRHTLSCFIRHHTYVRLTDRDGVHEYVCVRCGHPLAYVLGEVDAEATARHQALYRAGLARVDEVIALRQVTERQRRQDQRKVAVRDSQATGKKFPEFLTGVHELHARGSVASSHSARNQQDLERPRSAGIAGAS